MKTFLVGATGVIGQALVPKLLTRGDSVVALVRSLDRAAAIAGQNVELIEGDLLSIAPARLQGLLAGCDTAAHLATALRPGSPGLGTTNTNAALRTTGTRLLLDAVVAAGVPRYVQQSIALSYVDGGDTWLDEQTPFYGADNPESPSQVVIEMEAMVRALAPALVAWMILRGGAFVGNATRQDQVLSSLKDSSLRVPGDGSNWVSFVHVEDYADAVAAALHATDAAAVLNITDTPIRNGDYLDRLAALLGVPAPQRDHEASLPRSYRCTNAAARQVLGWQPSRGIWPRLNA